MALKLDASEISPWQMVFYFFLSLIIPGVEAKFAFMHICAELLICRRNVYSNFFFVRQLLVEIAGWGGRGQYFPPSLVDLVILECW